MPKFEIMCSRSLFHTLTIEAPSMEAAQSFYDNYQGTEEMTDVTSTHWDDEWDLTWVLEVNEGVVSSLSVDSEGKPLTGEEDGLP